MSSGKLDKATRRKLIEKGLQFLQSAQPFEGSDSDYEGFLRKLVSCLWADGDELYRMGDVATAQQQYGEALDVVEYMESEGLHCPSVVSECLHVNRAACYLRHDEYKKALEDCAVTLKLNEMNPQACYHKARALRAIGSVREAYDAVIICSKLMPQDEQVIALMQELAQALGLRLRKAYVSQAAREIQVTKSNIHDVISDEENVKLTLDSSPSESKSTLPSQQCNGKTNAKLIGSASGGNSGAVTKPATISTNTKGHKGSNGAVGSSAPPLPLLPQQAGSGSVVLPTQAQPTSKVGPTPPFNPTRIFTTATVGMKKTSKSASLLSAVGKSSAVLNPNPPPLRPSDAERKPPKVTVPIKETFPELVNGYGGGVSVGVGVGANVPLSAPMPERPNIDTLEEEIIGEDLDELLDRVSEEFSMQDFQSHSIMQFPPGLPTPPSQALPLFHDVQFHQALQIPQGLPQRLQISQGRQHGLHMSQGMHIPRPLGSQMVLQQGLFLPQRLQMPPSMFSQPGMAQGGPILDHHQQQCPPGFPKQLASCSSGLDSLDDVSTALPVLRATGAFNSDCIAYDGGHAQLHPEGWSGQSLPEGLMNAAKINFANMGVGFVGPAGFAGPGLAGVFMVNNPLADTHDLRQACALCFPIAAGSDILDYKYLTDLEHRCKKDLLIGRLRNLEDLRFKIIRPRPQNLNYMGTYYICKDIAEGKACRFLGHCRFAYNQEEIDVWTLERKGLMQRELLFAPASGADSLRVKLTLQAVLEEHPGIFIFLCEECFDNKPQILSKQSKENPKYCTNQSTRHVFDETKCLVYVQRSNTVHYSKIRPLNELSQFDICRHEIRYGCLREDKCNFAHSFVELKVWVMQQQSGITHKEIESECANLMARSRGVLAAPTHKISKIEQKHSQMRFHMKFVCSQCWRNGQVTEPEPTLKYCNSKARHTWSRERRVLLVMSPERKKWTLIRPFPSPKNVPHQFDLCAHVAKGKKCTFLGNCTFAHSQEEKEVWTYMRERNIKETEKLYEIWMETHGPKAVVKDTTGGTLLGNNGQSTDHISLPMDYADITSGFHCWLCGKNCNGGKQWQQHITSERHRDRVFLDDEGQHWQHRFPAGEFSLCSMIEHGNICPEDINCKYAHSAAELQEWIERRDYLKSKLAKAVNDKLIDENGDFGKYSFLTK